MPFTLPELLTHRDPKDYLSAWISGVVDVTTEPVSKNERLMRPFNKLSHALCQPELSPLECNRHINLLLLYTGLLQLRSLRLQELGPEYDDSCDILILGKLDDLIASNKQLFITYFLSFPELNDCPLLTYASYNSNTGEISSRSKEEIKQKIAESASELNSTPTSAIASADIDSADLLKVLSTEKLSDGALYFFIIHEHKHKLLEYIFEDARTKSKAMKALFNLDEDGNPSGLYRFLSIKVRHSIANGGSPLVTDHYTASLKKLVAQAHHFPGLMLKIILQNKLEQLYLLKDSAIKKAILNHIFQQDSATKQRMIKMALTPGTALHNYMAIPQSGSQNMPAALPYKMNTHSLDELCKKTVLSNPSIILNRLNVLQDSHKDWKKHLLLTCGQLLFDNCSRIFRNKDLLDAILEHFTEFQQDRKIYHLLEQFSSLQPKSRAPSP